MATKLLSHSIFLLLALSILMQVNIAHAKELKMGVESIEYYPIYAKREGKYSGFARELFDTFAKKYGHTISYKPLPIKRLFGEFLNGRLDLKFPDNAYWANDLKADKKVIYSGDVLEYIDGVMVLPENLKTGKSQLKTLGIVRGFTPWDYMEDIEAKKIKVIENNSLNGLVKMMQSNRMNGVYFNIAVARFFLKHTLFEENAIVFDESLPHSRNAYQLSTIKHPDIIDQLNSFLKEEALFVSELKTKYEVNL